jgi:hypothetical protein
LALAYYYQTFAIFPEVSDLQFGWTFAAGVGGLILGAFQAVVMRRNSIPFAQWVLATTIGWILGWYVGFAHLTTGLIFGGAIAVPQVLALRLQFRNTWWWAVASVVSWALIGYLTSQYLALRPHLEAYFVAAIALATSILSAVALFNMQRRHVIASSSLPPAAGTGKATLLIGFATGLLLGIVLNPYVARLYGSLRYPPSGRSYPSMYDYEIPKNKAAITLAVVLSVIPAAGLLLWRERPPNVFRRSLPFALATVGGILLLSWLILDLTIIPFW